METGNIVTIILSLEETFLHGRQGQVIQIVNDGNPEGPIGVRFGKQYAWLFGSDYDPKNSMRFEEDHLRVDKDWTPENKADMMFYRRWHNVTTFRDPLDPTKLCMHEECPNLRQKRILFNVWGSVCEADVCDAHAKEYHGMCMDMFPWR